MPLDTLVTLILCGGLLGILGQGVRTVVGLKKRHDVNGTTPLGAQEAFSSQRLLISLFIGFIAGALTVLVTTDARQTLEDTEQFRLFALTVVAAGYSGTDFIEGVFNRFLSGLGGPVPSPAASPLPALAHGMPDDAARVQGPSAPGAPSIDNALGS
jgi:putative chitinase